MCCGVIYREHTHTHAWGRLECGREQLSPGVRAPPCFYYHVYLLLPPLVLAPLPAPPPRHAHTQLHPKLIGSFSKGGRRWGVVQSQGQAIAAPDTDLSSRHTGKLG